MGGKKSRLKYELPEESSVEEEEDGDDLIEHKDYTKTQHNKSYPKVLELLQKFKKFKELYAERMKREKILSPRTLFREIFEKKIQDYTSQDILVLESYMELRLTEWEKEDNAATRFQKVWRGRQGRQRVYEEKEKIRQKQVALRMEYFLARADKRREEHNIFAMSNEALKTKIIEHDQLISGSNWLKNKISNDILSNIRKKKREQIHNDQSDYNLRKRADEFFRRQHYLRIWNIWKQYTFQCRQLKMSALLYLRHNFQFWNRKCKQWKHVVSMLKMIIERMYLGFKRVYFNVWWRRVRKNFKIVRSKQSKYTVLVESADLIFPTVKKKVLLDYSATYNDDRYVQTTHYAKTSHKTYRNGPELEEGSIEFV